jgi:hypothetical protein
MLDYVTLLIAFLSGFLTKFVDLEEHELKVRKLVIYLTGISYGILIAYVVKTEPVVAPLAFAAIVGVLLTGKIDSKGHMFGIVSFFLFMTIWGIPVNFVQLYFAYFLLMSIVAMAEEYVNTWMLDNGKIRNKTLKSVLSVRPGLEVTTFCLSAVTGLWPLWYVLFFYDLGYNLINNSFVKLAKRKLS